MTRTLVDATGAVVLSDDVVCDGFVDGPPARIQTHVHDDHMARFDTSKGYQDIYALHGTRDLLVMERNADLMIRRNFIGLGAGEERSVGDSRVELHDSGHMLGSAQVLVEHPDGYRTGYSGDFSWPLNYVIEVDEIVVDSTYGSPNSVRRYAQQDAEQALAELLLAGIKDGPVYVKAFRGTLQRALAVLADIPRFPVIATPRHYADAQVYERHGYESCGVLEVGTEQATEAMAENRYIFVQGKGERPPASQEATVLILSAFWTSPDHPVLQLGDRVYSIAMSDHADFAGTLEYIRATGASLVLTDNIRGPHGVALAEAVRQRLGVKAVAAVPRRDRSWGGSADVGP